jgi:hypothetical protein
MLDTKRVALLSQLLILIVESTIVTFKEFLATVIHPPSPRR